MGAIISICRPTFKVIEYTVLTDEQLRARDRKRRQRRYSFKYEAMKSGWAFSARRIQRDEQRMKIRKGQSERKKRKDIRREEIRINQRKEDFNVLKDYFEDLQEKKIATNIGETELPKIIYDGVVLIKETHKERRDNCEEEFAEEEKKDRLILEALLDEDEEDDLLEIQENQKIAPPVFEQEEEDEFGLVEEEEEEDEEDKKLNLLSYVWLLAFLL